MATALIHDAILLKENDAAIILNVKVATLRRWRWAGIGPTFHKIGAFSVRYDRQDLESFIEAGRRRSTSETDVERA